MPDPMNALAAPASAVDWIWRNGALHRWLDATVHVNAVGHASVSAVFEGIKAYLSDDQTRLLVFRLDDHLIRLSQSVRLSRLSLPYTTHELGRACIDLLTANAMTGDTYLRPWVFPKGIIREQMVPAGAECEVVIDSWPFRTHLRSGTACRAGVSSWQRIDDAATPPRIKAFSNYHNGRLALLEARENGHDWPILLNRNGKVSEGAAACLALVRDGTVITPPVTSGILDGITRNTAITLLREGGLVVQERDVDRSELYLADEVFFLGTAWEILPVGVVDGMTVGSGDVGPVAATLERRYDDLVRGRTGSHPDWITEVRLGQGPVDSDTSIAGERILT